MQLNNVKPVSELAYITFWLMCWCDPARPTELHFNDTGRTLTLRWFGDKNPYDCLECKLELDAFAHTIHHTYNWEPQGVHNWRAQSAASMASTADAFQKMLAALDAKRLSIVDDNYGQALQTARDTNVTRIYDDATCSWIDLTPEETQTIRED